MAGAERKEGESYLNPNAVAFQPFAQPIIIQDNYQYYPRNVYNQNIVTQRFLSNQFCPRQGQSAYGNFGIININQQQSPMNRRSRRKYARYTITYDRVELKSSTIAKLGVQNQKSQSMQPDSISDLKHSFLNCLVSGYCRKFSLPADLVVLLIKYCGNEVQILKTQIAVGISTVDPMGFFCVEMNSDTVIQYWPSTKYAMNDYTIIATATDLMLPSHFINHYNEITNNALSKYSRFNAIFITPKEAPLFDHSIEIFCILFNNEHALELRIPLFQSLLRKHHAATYSTKYGLIICCKGSLLSFCWNNWSWVEIAQDQYAFNGIKFMHYFEKQNKIFTFNFYKKCCYLYDVNDGTIERVSCRDTILSSGYPIFCADNVNEQIYAFQTIGKKNARGMCIRFEISTCQWKYTFDCNGQFIGCFPRRKAPSVHQMWFREADQALCVFTSKYKRELCQFWKISTIDRMSEWKPCKDSKLWMRDDIEYVKL